VNSYLEKLLGVKMFGDDMTVEFFVETEFFLVKVFLILVF